MRPFPLAAPLYHAALCSISMSGSAIRMEPRSRGVRLGVAVAAVLCSRATAFNTIADSTLNICSCIPQVYIIEANPRASRTVPFVAKAIGHPVAKYASLLMAGLTLADIGFTEEPTLGHVAVKEAVLPFDKFPGVRDYRVERSRRPGFHSRHSHCCNNAVEEVWVRARVGARFRSSLAMHALNTSVPRSSCLLYLQSCICSTLCMCAYFQHEPDLGIDT